MAVWICHMEKIVCFSARFFIHPHYTKEKITKALNYQNKFEIKDATIQTFSVKKGFLQVTEEWNTDKHTKYSTETRILTLKIFSENLKNSFLQTTPSGFY